MVDKRPFNIANIRVESAFLAIPVKRNKLAFAVYSAALTRHSGRSVDL